MNRLEELLVLILDRAHKLGKKDLSRFEIFKIVYLLQNYSLKYVGIALLKDITFIREKNGPISIDIYNAMEELIKKKCVKKIIKENEEYGHPRHCFSLNKKYSKSNNFSQGELIFLDNFVSELLSLNQTQLKRKAYETEPMKLIKEKERGNKIQKGSVIDFSNVSVDPDVVDAYSSGKV